MAAISIARDDDRPRPGVIPLSGSREAPPPELDPRLLAPIDARPWAFLYRPFSSHLLEVAAVRLFRPPGVLDHPMIWKETYHGSNALAAELLRTICLGVILIEAIAGAFLILSVMPYAQVPTRITLQWHSLFQLIVLNLLSVAILGCAAFAAGSITHESEQGTLEAILVLPAGDRRCSYRNGSAASFASAGRWRRPILPLAFGLMIGASIGP